MIVRRTFVALVVALVLAAIPATASASGRPAASYYTKQQLQAMSQRYAAKAAFDALTPEQRQTLIASWDAQTRLISDSQSSSTTFGWGDFGIGAAAMLGVVLLAGGLTVAARHSKYSKSRVQPRFGA